MRPARSATSRQVAGVAAGLAEQLGVRPLLVRAAFLALLPAGGLGLVLYLLMWGGAVESGRVVEAPAAEATARQKIGLAALVVGLLFLMRGLGLWLGDVFVWTMAFVIMGVAAVWDREGGTPTWANPSERPAIGQVLLGGALMIGGAWALSALSPEDITRLGSAALGLVGVLAGFALVFGRFVWRLGTDLGTERRERIRSEERAEMAAHLHDSVLQTLALIQRTDDPKQMNVLARGQERELRDWLYGAREGHERLSDALQAVAGRVERDHRLPVEVIVVNDFPMDDSLNALVGAAGEAMTNAAKHSGADLVSVYAEHTGEAIEVFVSDQGKGFDPTTIAADRRGLVDSVVGRMERHGGSASIDSEPGEGTEVTLRLAIDLPEPEGTSE
ncbi:MAG: PspC domain-containing protein [Acidimicrobiia bacterium]|nr:PspC domain-containing protein [Acidimicrobiia bacterium]